MEQSLLLRGHRDFESREAYRRFLMELVAGRNKGRRKRLDEELPRLAAFARSAPGELQASFVARGPGKPDPRRP